MTRLIAVVVSPGLLLGLAPSAPSQELAEVVANRERLQARLDESSRRLEELRARMVVLEQELAGLDARREQLTANARLAEAALAEHIRKRYVHGNVTPLAALLSGDGPSAAAERAQILQLLERRDVAAIEQALALRTALDQTEALARAGRDELADLEPELTAQTAELQATLEKAQRLETTVRTRDARQKRVASGPQQGVYSCIFDRPHHFIDSWGFPRSGGRRHQGADVMAPRGVNVYAFTGGRILSLRNGGLGGIALHLLGDDGNRYYYAHLQGYADGLRGGTRVEAGQLLAYNGDSGNAKGGPTHVHFQVHPGGGAPTNPYRWLRAVCP